MEKKVYKELYLPSQFGGIIGENLSAVYRRIGERDFSHGRICFVSVSRSHLN
jgi:pSer/pThr/pTyr-binding forkhead associated (FHA) protein